MRRLHPAAFIVSLLVLVVFATGCSGTEVAKTSRLPLPKALRLQRRPWRSPANRRPWLGGRALQRLGRARA